MKESSIICNLINNSAKPLLNKAGFVLSLSGVVVASIFCFFERIVKIERPLLLLMASLFTLVGFKKNISVILVQKIISLYLISVLVNEVSLHYIEIPGYHTKLQVPVSLVILILLAAGYFMNKKYLYTAKSSEQDKSLLLCWAAVAGILIIHMFFLILLLTKFYGYGYEYDMSVLGCLCLYFLTYLALWRPIDSLFFRQMTGAVLVFLFISLFIFQ